MIYVYDITFINMTFINMKYDREEDINFNLWGYIGYSYPDISSILMGDSIIILCTYVFFFITRLRVIYGGQIWIIET